MNHTAAVPLLLLTLFALSFVCSKIIYALFELECHVLSELLEYPAKLLSEHPAEKKLLTIALFVFYFLSAGSFQHPAELALAWLFITLMIFITFIDYQQHIIPDRILLPAAVAALLLTPLLSSPLTDRMIAAAAGGAVFLLLAIITRGGIGGGDIKLLFVLGLWLGSDRLLTATLLGFIAGGIASAILLLTKAKKAGQMIAYGPYFAISAILTLFK